MRKKKSNIYFDGNIYKKKPNASNGILKRGPTNLSQACKSANTLHNLLLKHSKK